MDIKRGDIVLLRTKSDDYVVIATTSSAAGRMIRCCTRHGEPIWTRESNVVWVGSP